MAQAGYTPISLYYSTTAAAVPLAANLAQGELAINIADGKLYYENSSGVVTLLASSTTVTNSFSAGTTGFTPSTATTGAVTLAGTLITSNGGTGLASYTAGDLSYYASGTALTKLAIGTAGQFLTSTGTAPQWSTLSGVAVTTFSAGTTGFTPSSATSGAVTLAGTLATTNGGTGLTSFTSGGVVYASSTSALATGSALTFDGTKLGVNGGLVADSNIVAQINSPSTTAKFFGFNRSGDFGLIIGYDNTNDYASIRTVFSYPIVFSVNNTEQMRLTTTGLGIGTTPTEKFQVYKAAGDTLSYGSNPRLILTVPTGTNGMRIVADTTPFEATHPTNGSQFGIGADANVTINAVNATSGATTKNSPTIAFLSKYWNGSASASQMQGFIGVTSTAATSTGGYFGLGIGAADALRINSSGNLGLATTPSVWGNSYVALQVQSIARSLAATGAGAGDLTLAFNAVYDSTDSRWEFAGTGDKAGRYSQTGGGSSHVWYVTDTNGTADAAITFIQAMTLNSSGNLLVGDTSAQYSARLYVNGSIAARNSGVDGTYQDAFIAAYNGNYNEKNIIQSQVGGASGFRFQASNGGGSASVTNVMDALINKVQTYVPINVAGASRGTSYISHTVTSSAVLSTSADSTSFTDVVYMANSGQATGSSYYSFYAYRNNFGTVTAWIRGDGTYGSATNVYGSTSDARLKTDIVDAGSQWNDVKAFRVRKFRMKDDATNTVQLGVVAQEVEVTSPGLVEDHKVVSKDGKTGDTFKTVKYSILYMKSVKALQEAMERIEQLEARLAAANL